MKMGWSEGEQTLEIFLEEDLPFLIQSPYKATLVVLKKKLQLVDSSLDLIIYQYPNFLEKIKYHLFFFFAHQISILYSNSNNDHAAPRLDFVPLRVRRDRDLFNHYYSVASAYEHQYIYSFVDKQIQDISDRSSK